MEEDAEEPKEPAHLDYKYLKSFVGPLTGPSRDNDILEKKESD